MKSTERENQMDRNNETKAIGLRSDIDQAVPHSFREMGTGEKVAVIIAILALVGVIAMLTVNYIGNQEINSLIPFRKEVALVTKDEASLNSQIGSIDSNLEIEKSLDDDFAPIEEGQIGSSDSISEIDQSLESLNMLMKELDSIDQDFNQFSDKDAGI